MLHKQSGYPVGWRWMAILALAMLALPQVGRAQVTLAEDAPTTEATWKDWIAYYIVTARSVPPSYGEHVMGAGVSEVDIDGVRYGVYCLDMYASIDYEDTLLIDGLYKPLPAEGIDWCAVQYLIYTFGDTTDPVQAAAVQCAIWYFTTAHYGPYVSPSQPYQFMTDPGPPAETNRYDGWIHSSWHAGIADRAEVRRKALEMKDNVPRDEFGVCTFQVPTEIGLVASDDHVYFKMGETPSTLLMALVLDQNSSPVANVQVSFIADFGDLSTTTVLTNALGEATVELTNTEGLETQSNVCAWVEGNYVVYLNGTGYNPIRQDMGMFPLLPDTVQDCVTIDWTKKTTCCEYGSKLKSLTMQYTAEGKSASSHSQDPSKVVINDYMTPPLPDKVRIIAVDKDSPFHYQAHKFFDGIVELGDEIKIEAITGGQTRFSADLRIFILDPTPHSCKILQSIKFHVSCSQPLMTGDQFGSMLVVECDGTTVKPPHPKPDCKKKCEDFYKKCRKYFDYKCDKDWKYKSCKKIYSSFKKCGSWWR